jgi:hypothetical protein
MLLSSSYLLCILSSLLQLVSSTKTSDVDYTAPTALADENRWSMFREVAS